MSPEPMTGPADRLGVRGLMRRLMSERLDPWRGAAAVFLGITFGIVPIYGLQAIAALALATLFGLNRPLTFAATFINNPILQPFLVIGSVELGYLAMRGSFVALSPSMLTARGLVSLVQPLFVGSIILAAMVGGIGAATAYLLLAHRARAAAGVHGEGIQRGGDAAQSANGDLDRSWRAYIDDLFRSGKRRDRGFVRWKIRLDHIFSLLAREDLGTGPAVDLGCGHGSALALVSYRARGRTLYGCDLDAGRIAAAGRALAGLDVHLKVADVRAFDLPEAGLILIIDVLQYLDPREQVALLRRCTAALQPGGRLIFRLPDLQRGFCSWTTSMLDRIILSMGRAKARPVYQALDAYTALLADAGMSVVVRRTRNILPLAHVVFAATKPR